MGDLLVAATATVLAAPSGVGSVTVGYLLTAAGLGGYVGHLALRARRARRSAAVAAGRARDRDRR
jgi:hypothetical protein